MRILFYLKGKGKEVTPVFFEELTGINHPIGDENGLRRAAQAAMSVDDRISGYTIIGADVEG